MSDVGESKAQRVATLVGKAGIDLVCQALQLGPVATFVNTAIDVWKVTTEPPRRAFVEAVAEEHPDLLQRVEGMRNGDPGALRPDQLELIQAGFASIRPTTTEQRAERVARLVSAGLSEAKISTSRAARLTRLFSQLDDEDVLVLLAYDPTRTKEEQADIRAHHPQIFGRPMPRPRILSEGEPAPPGESEEQRRERKVAQTHLSMIAERLCSLGVLSHQYDNEGRISHDFWITAAGKELLQSVGLLIRPDRLPPWETVVRVE